MATKERKYVKEKFYREDVKEQTRYLTQKLDEAVATAKKANERQHKIDGLKKSMCG